MLVIKAAGERQRGDKPVPEPFGVRNGGHQVASRGGDLAAMEGDQCGEAEISTRYPWLLQVLWQRFKLGQHIVPAPRLEQELGQCAVRLRQPERGADLV